MNFMSEMKSDFKKEIADFSTKANTITNKPVFKRANVVATVATFISGGITFTLEQIGGYNISKKYVEMCNARNAINDVLANAVDKKIENSNGLMDLSELNNYPVVEVPQFIEEERAAKTKLGKFLNKCWKKTLTGKYFINTTKNLNFFEKTFPDFDLNWTPESTIIWAQNHGVLDDEVLNAVNAHTAVAEEYNDAVRKAKRFKEIESCLLVFIDLPCFVILTFAGVLGTFAGL